MSAAVEIVQRRLDVACVNGCLHSLHAVAVDGEDRWCVTGVESGTASRVLAEPMRHAALLAIAAFGLPWEKLPEFALRQYAALTGLSLKTTAALMGMGVDGVRRLSDAIVSRDPGDVVRAIELVEMHAGWTQ